MSFLSSIAGTLGGFGDSLFQGFTDEYFSRRDIKYKDALNWQHWNAQNEYNSPAAQMQRFRDAGLNPNLIYGQSNLAGSVSPASGGVSVDSPLSNVYTREQMRNMRAQNDNMHAQNVLTKEQARSLKLQNDLTEKAGDLADAPGWMRAVVRMLPKELRTESGGLNLSPYDIMRFILGGVMGQVDLFDAGVKGVIRSFDEVYHPFDRINHLTRVHDRGGGGR